MIANINLLIDSVHNATKFLHRDYFELENLQNSSRGTENFVNRATIKTEENLKKSLGKYYKNILFDDSTVSAENNQSIILVEILDGRSNFSRSLPFFAVIATILVKEKDKLAAKQVVINFPALNYTYYAEKGKGAWLERSLKDFHGGKSRLRVSGKNKLEEALLGCNNKNLALVQNFSKNIRNFESSSYQAILLASGKLDFIIDTYKVNVHEGLELLICEAGGIIFIKDDIFIASNENLQNKIKLFI